MGPDAPHGRDDLAPLIEPFLEHEAPAVRGAAAWSAGRLGLASLAGRLEALRGDPSPVFLLVDGEVAVRSVEEVASSARAAL
jgi:hypothetical protein